MAKPVKFAIREGKFRNQFGMVMGKAGPGQQQGGDLAFLHPARAGAAGTGQNAAFYGRGDGLLRLHGAAEATLAPTLAVVLLLRNPLPRGSACGGLAALEGVVDPLVEVAPVIVGDLAVPDLLDDLAQGALQAGAALGG